MAYFAGSILGQDAWADHIVSATKSLSKEGSKEVSLMVKLIGSLESALDVVCLLKTTVLLLSRVEGQ